ncbi:MAG: WD40 domain-containing protein [Pirellulales bacterium]
MRCFLRDFSDQQRRYNLIANHLQNHRLPYLVQFEYLPSGIRAQGSLFPILKMQWIEGKPLNRYIEEHLTNSSDLEAVGKRWCQLLGELRKARIAHGDLQHGNVLVLPNGELRLIDYDGMWVPALDGMGSHEVGHSAYQSPKRTERDFHERIDDFAGTVIALALRAVRCDPMLWRSFNNDDNILFTRQDFLDTSQSMLFATLLGLRDTEITAMATQLIQSCGGGTPLAIAAGRGWVVGGSPPHAWIGDFVPGFSPSGTASGESISFDFAFSQAWKRPGERRVAKVRTLPIYVTKIRQFTTQETVTNTPLAWAFYIALQVVVAAAIPQLLVFSIFLGLFLFGVVKTTQSKVVKEKYQEQSGTRDVTEFVTERIPGHSAPVSRVALGQDGRCVFSSDIYGTIAGWNTADGAETDRAQVFRHEITGLRAVNGRAGSIAACSGRTITLQGVDGAIVREFTNNHQSNFYNIAVSRDGRLLAGAIGVFKILLWEVANGRLIRTFGSHRKKVLAVAFSPDGKFLASGSADMTAKIWLVSRERCVYTLNGHTSEVNAVAFSPDGRLLASGGNDGCVFLWDVLKGQQLMQCSTQGGGVNDVVFAPTSSHVIAACSDGRIRCWDVRSGRQLPALAAHSGAVVSVDISADGRQLVSGGTDGLVHWSRSS